MIIIFIVFFKYIFYLINTGKAIILADTGVLIVFFDFVKNYMFIWMS